MKKSKQNRYAAQLGLGVCSGQVFRQKRKPAEWNSKKYTIEKGALK